MPIALVPGIDDGSRAGDRKHAGEPLGPGILDIERDRVGQEALEQFRRLVRRVHGIEPVFLGDAEILAKALDVIHDLAAGPARGLQQRKAPASHDRGDIERHGWNKSRPPRLRQIQPEADADADQREDDASDKRNGAALGALERRKYQPTAAHDDGDGKQQPDRQSGHQVGALGEARRDHNSEIEQYQKPEAEGRPAVIVVEQLAEIAGLQLLLQLILRLAEDFVVELRERDGFRRREQLALHRRLFGGDGAAALALRDGRLLAAAVDLQMPVHAEIDDGDGEAAIVEAHPIDIARGGRRHARRRSEQRDDGAARRIAADPPPGEKIIEQNDQHARDRDRGHAVVFEPIADACCDVVGGVDDALLPCRRHGEAAVRRQSPRGAKDDAAGRLLDDSGILAARALRPGIERALLERHARRQRDARLGLIDREGPAGAGGVPVQLVVVGEEADLPRGAIFDDVFVRAVGDGDIGTADAHAHAVREALERPVFRSAVARDRLHVEADFDARAVVARVDGRKIPQDAAADFLAFGLHAMVSVTGRSPLRSTATSLMKFRMRSSAMAGASAINSRTNAVPRRCRTHGFRSEKATDGAAAAERSSSSKKGSALKPNTPASTLFGNDWMLMLRLRTVPL